MEAIMLGAKTWPWTTVGPIVNSIGCRSWRPIWFAAGRSDRHHRRSRFGPRSLGRDDDSHRLARPGGNLTGINFFAFELAAKRLELLRELVPTAARVAVLVNPANVANTETTLRDVEPAARNMGLQIQVLTANNSRAMGRERPDALFIATTPFLNAAPAYTCQKSPTPWQLGAARLQLAQAPAIGAQGRSAADRRGG